MKAALKILEVTPRPSARVIQFPKPAAAVRKYWAKVAAIIGVAYVIALYLKYRIS